MNNDGEKYTTVTITVGSATVRIHRPILTEDERKRREGNLIDVLSKFGKVLQEGEGRDAG